jgi:caffeoyl-CoA O-methyltransferase
VDIVDARIEAYAEAHTTPSSELFERLAAETREKTEWPGMMIGDTAGRFLEFLVRLSSARRVLEIGTFTGYSSLFMARGLREGGQIISCDVNAETTAIARRYAEEAGLADRIDYRVGPGLETVSALEGPFDLVFIDADKTGYLAYYEAALPKLADAGLIVADNALMSGRVVDEESDELSRAMQDFNDHVRNDSRVECVLLTVRDGMLLAMKR